MVGVFSAGWLMVAAVPHSRGLFSVVHHWNLGTASSLIVIIVIVVSTRGRLENHDGSSEVDVPQILFLVPCPWRSADFFRLFGVVDR